MSEPLIQRYEHNHFHGWLVRTKRRGRQFSRYLSDRPHGKQKALRAARAFRDKLIAALPTPTKLKRTYVRNTTGIVGVSRIKERTRSGKSFVRYVAQWPERSGDWQDQVSSRLSRNESAAFCRASVPT